MDNTSQSIKKGNIQVYANLNHEIIKLKESASNPHLNLDLNEI